MTIDDEASKQEKRPTLAIESKKKKKKRANPPDSPIPLPDRVAKRKADIPDEAPDPDEKVRKLGRQLVKVLARGAPSLTYKAMQKARHNPTIIDIGQLPLPPPFSKPSPRDVFSGKGRRLADDDPAPKGVIKTGGQFSKKPIVKKKPGGVSGRARSKANTQLALMPVDEYMA